MKKFMLSTAVILFSQFTYANDSVSTEAIEPPFNDCASQNFLDQRDCQALVALYTSTDGNNWNERLTKTWLKTRNPCEWEGVVCDVFLQQDLNNPGMFAERIRVTGLHLPKGQLMGPIPREIGQLSQLMQLNLAANQLTGYIPRSIGLLSRLSMLILSENQLNGVIPREMGYLVNLQSLALSRNDLVGPFPKTFKHLKDLNQVQMEGNFAFADAIPQHFTESRITRLGIHGTDICIPNNQAMIEWIERIDFAGEENFCS